MAAKKSGTGKTPPKGPGYSTSTKGNRVQVQNRQTAGSANPDGAKGKRTSNNLGTSATRRNNVDQPKGVGSRASSVATSNKMSGRTTKRTGKK